MPKRKPKPNRPTATHGSAAENPVAVRSNRDRGLEHLLAFLKVEGTSGRETAIAEAVKQRLIAAGCKPRWIAHDQAHRKIGDGFEIGNLIVKIPGQGTLRRAPRRLFMGHLDTVPLCRGARPKRVGNRLVAAGNTALGGDNRTAIGALVTMVETVLGKGLDHPPMTIVMTVGEEVGLRGARHLDPKRLGNPVMGFNVDGGDPVSLRIGAIGADRWEAYVHGRSSHAGAHPEDGVSATLIASRAIDAVANLGFFGKVEIGGKVGSSNVGIFRGGETTNQVTDEVYLKGECRSHNPAFLARITKAYRTQLDRAARSVRNASGEHGSVTFTASRDYDAFRISKNAPCVVAARKALQALGQTASYEIANGGLDANKLNELGIPTVTLGAGQHSPHTVDEYIELEEYHLGCDLLIELATAL